jgi:ferredoxin
MERSLPRVAAQIESLANGRLPHPAHYDLPSKIHSNEFRRISGRSLGREGITRERERKQRPSKQEKPMAFVVTEPCFGCKYTDCVVVCPCDCFREGDQMLFIDPEHCIDCDACVPECPVDAIFYEDDVPDQWREFVALNREMAAVWPPITDRKEPLVNRGATS